MDYQTAFNVAIGLIGIGMGWMLRTLNERLSQQDQRMERLETEDKALARNMADLALSSASKSDLREMEGRITAAIHRLFDKMDTMQAQIANKVDRGEIK